MLAGLNINFLLLRKKEEGRSTYLQSNLGQNINVNIKMANMHVGWMHEYVDIPILDAESRPTDLVLNRLS